MLRRLLGGPVDATIIEPQGYQEPSITHNMVYDDKTILAIVAALLYMPNQTPTQTVDIAAALLREVNAR